METSVTQQPRSLQQMLSADNVNKRFKEILGEKTPGFISSIISATKQNPSLSKCDPGTIISSAMVAAILDLPINSNLGFAHIVPYGDKAQFQMGWKGYVQLALRTSQYGNIHAAELYEGELVSHNRITGEVIIDSSKRTTNVVVGYVAYFRLINGFEKYLYMTKEQCEAHGKKYSKSYGNQYGKWKTDFDAMALKTVIKQLLSKYGILSIEMQKAITADNSVIKDAETMDVEYTDANETTPLAIEEKTETAENSQTLFTSTDAK